MLLEVLGEVFSFDLGKGVGIREGFLEELSFRWVLKDNGSELVKVGGIVLFIFIRGKIVLNRGEGSDYFRI